MAFLFSSPKTSPETAGAAAEPEVALRYPKLNAAAVKALDLQHSLIMTPLTSPEMELPYLVRQAGGVLGCDKHISRSGRPHYYLVTFNTHSAKFTVSEFKEKWKARQAYADAMNALLVAAPGYMPLGQTKVKYLRNGLGCFRQLPTSLVWRILFGVFAGARRAQVKDRFVKFGGAGVRAGSKVGAIVQATTSYKAASLKGLNGSWENMLEYARITHEAGGQQASIGASVADFIGLWSSVTGNVASLDLASGGFIDPSANFQNCWKTFTAASFKSRHNPYNNTIITFSYDTASAWV